MQSEETRTHLNAAHNRVLSVGAMQQHLMPGGRGAVELRAYFTQLCQSLAASMIPDPKLVTLTVKADEAWLDAEEAVSLGLIVTELTINALKHAFPDRRRGTLRVVMRGEPEGMVVMSVHDDGVGMPIVRTSISLGMQLVGSLTEQLEGTLEQQGNAGTTFTIRFPTAA